MAVEDGPVPGGPALLLAFDRRSKAPLHEQLERMLRDQVRGGRLAPHTRLPSSRALAAQLGVSRGVVLEAYAQLTAEGYLISSQGAPTRIAATGGGERPPVPARALTRRFEYDFDPGLPDLSAFPREQWLRSQRAAIRDSPFDSVAQPDPRGAPELRNELASYLGRVRGAAPEPEHMLICSGFAGAFACLCRTLRDRGIDRIALEEPGWSRHRLVATGAGLEPAPVVVDERGIDVVALARSECEVVVVTPAHQFPTGVVLASERRAALLEWAEDRDAMIVEDDYDSELRYDRVAIGALQGLAPERVCQIGSMSKRLAPGLGLGWMLSPSWLTGALTFAQGLAAGAPPVLDQLALADFIGRGELDRHLRRVRLLYRDRREALVATLTAQLPEASVAGIAAGIFVLAVISGLDRDEENALVSAASERGVSVEALGWHRAASGGDGGLVLGFGNLAEPAIARGVAALAEVILRRAGSRDSASTSGAR